MADKENPFDASILQCYFEGLRNGSTVVGAFTETLVLSVHAVLHLLNAAMHSDLGNGPPSCISL